MTHSEGLLAAWSPASIFTYIRVFYWVGPFYYGCLSTALPLEDKPAGADWAVCLPLEGFSNAYEAHFTMLGRKPVLLRT